MARKARLDKPGVEQPSPAELLRRVEKLDHELRKIATTLAIEGKDYIDWMAARADLQSAQATLGELSELLFELARRGVHEPAQARSALAAVGA